MPFSIAADWHRMFENIHALAVLSASFPPFTAILVKAMFFTTARAVRRDNYAQPNLGQGE